MAGGYLGKISAVVSANTGDYVRKLNDSASTTRSFAKSISSDLSRASRDASKSIESILTPLQRFERAIQNAASQKLAFRGFDGAIQTVEQLRKAIEKVADRPVELQFLLKQTGLKTLEEIRQTIGSISEKNLQLALSVGGLEGLRRLRSEVEEVNGKLVNVKVETDATELDRLISVFSQIAPERVRQLKIDVETRQIEQAVALNKQLVSVATEITSSYSRAKQQFSGFGLDVQAALGPAFKSADSGILKLLDDIDNRVPITEERFRSLASEAKKATATIATFSEAQQKLGGLSTGNELSFQFPRLNANLADAQRAGQRASQLPAARIAANPEIEGLARQINRVSELAVSAAAKMRSAMTGQEAAVAAAEYSKLNGVLERLIAKQNAASSGKIDGFFDIGFLKSSAVAAKQAQDAAVQIEVAADALVRSARRVRDAQEQARQNAAANLPLIDVGFVRSSAVAAAEAQRTAVQIEVAADALVRSARRVRDAQEQARYNESSNLPMIDIGFVRASAVNAGEAQRAAVQIDIAASALEESARRLRAAQEAAQFGPTALPPSFRGDSRAGLGRDAADERRQLDVLTSRSNSLKSSFDSLPEGIRAQFIPAIQEADSALLRLKAAPQQTAEEIERVSARFTTVEQAVTRATTAAQRFGGSFADFRAERDIRGAAAGLEFLRTQLLRATGDSSKAAAVLDRLAEALQDAASTPGGFQKNAAELKSLTSAAIQAVSATNGVGKSQGALESGFNRAGDVARGSFGNVGLAVQQAAYAFEDFFSVTGGLDQRIRAAGNNISQLGFIIGGAWGLGVGIAVSVGAQFAAMLIKWANNGRTAEDQLRALNEVIAEQKSLTSEIATSFEALSDSIAGRGFSEAAERAREFKRALEEVVKKQDELRQSRLIELDPVVAANRDRQQVIQRQLQQEAVDPEQRIRLQLELDSLRKQEAAARRRVLGEAAAGPDYAAGRRDIALGFEAQRLSSERDANARRIALTLARTQGPSQGALNRADFFTGELQSLRTDQQRIEAARRRQADLRSAALANPSGADLANNAIVAIERIIRVLEDRIASGAALDRFLSSINDASTAIQSAQSQVSAAITAGIPAATLLQGTLDKLQQQIDDAQNAIGNANSDFANGLIDAGARNDIIRGSQETIDNASAARQRATAEAAALTRQRIVDPQVLFDARRQRAEANLQAAGLEGGAIARQIRELEAQREVIRSRIAQAPEAQREAVRQQVAAEEAALNQQLAALEASTVALRRFTEELDRASQEAQSNLQSAQQRADDVRRASLAPGEGLAVPSDADRARADRNLQEQRRAEQRVQDEVAQARIRAEQRAADQADPLAAVFQRLREIEEAARGGTLTPAMIEERRRLNQQVDAAVQQDPAVVAARDNSTRIEERQRAEQRGRDLAMTDAERAAREAARQAADITASFAVDAGLDRRVVLDRQGQQDAINRLAENQIRQVAPLIAGFREERLNAMLQGPSRAALNVADAQTTEGARELNRLLRGDDPNKDVNLVELQKQTEALERVIKAIEENAAGAIVDIRG